MFFALSGFVIAHSVHGDRVTWPFLGRFMLRRAIRLDPPYWAALVLTLLSGWVSSMLVEGKAAPSFTGEQVLAHAVYLQEMLGYPHVNIIIRTLCQEVQFYFVCVMMLAVARNDPGLPLQGRRTAIILAAAFFIALQWPLGILSAGPWPGSFLPLWYAFLHGVGAYWAWRQRHCRAL